MSEAGVINERKDSHDLSTRWWIQIEKQIEITWGKHFGVRGQDVWG